ncbi:MAG: nicotinic acid mononucleotide adenyltransferase [Flavobacteriaceae bacterium]|nr:nicotinic acid mononucleotide adenyltransferase [Flavobacteriaceae bacterium]
MKSLKLLFLLCISVMFFTSCEVDVIAGDDSIVEDPISLEQLLASHELWYVDINQTTGPGEVPFLQKAFTVSYRYGVMYANNNLVGIGTTGGGFGIDVGFYNTYGGTIEIHHDLDGFWALEVYQLGPNRIKMYDPYTNTSYYLTGYQRSTFDYDLVFYDNIHYFLQEYVAWEKVFTSAAGDPSPFDNENFLQFLASGNGINFRSSQDQFGTPLDFIYWDYSGIYEVNDVYGDAYLKTLALDYDYSGNEFFELIILNDNKIELYNSFTGTTYRFKGSGFIQYKNADGKKRKKITNKVRKLKKDKKV